MSARAERYLAEIERLLKKKIEVAGADGFDPSEIRPERRERAPREAAKPKAGERPARAPRGRGPKPAPGSAEGVARHRERTIGDAPRAPSHGETRREERERAYALNPDQPVPPRAAPAATAAHPHARKPFGHGRPVPALLMKRKTTEPEKV